MKHLQLIILTFLLITPGIGQNIEKIIFTSQRADEPPTKQGMPKYTIEFIREVNGDLVTFYYKEDKKRKKLSDKIVIDKKRVERTTHWKAIDKKDFTPTELEIDHTSLKSGLERSQLSFGIPTDFTVSVDSFQYCQNFKMTKILATGGETITVTLVNSLGQKSNYVFNSNDIGQGNFDLQNYLFCSTLLKDKIPSVIPNNDFFSEEMLRDILLSYQKTVECEGYYYKEYIENNPQISIQERRTMTNWNFVEYMKNRKK
jgi:hypothetical protein